MDLTRLCSSEPAHPLGTLPKWYVRSDFRRSRVGASLATCRLTLCMCRQVGVSLPNWSTGAPRVVADLRREVGEVGDPARAVGEGGVDLEPQVGGGGLSIVEVRDGQDDVPE